MLKSIYNKYIYKSIPKKYKNSKMERSINYGINK